MIRELQEIAKASGGTQPDPKADGEPLPEDQYEQRIENLIDNLDRILPEYNTEMRQSRRHGGYEFIIRPCPLGSHDKGNDSGLISMAPSGKLCWHCFHSSHTMPWKEARTMIEDQTGQKFVFPPPPAPILGRSKSGLQHEPIEEMQIKFAPEEVPRLEIDKADYVDHLADELTRETRLPFSFARETLKMFFLASLPDTRPGESTPGR